MIFALLASDIALSVVVANIVWLLRQLPGAADLPVLNSVARLVARERPHLPGTTGAHRNAIEDNLSRRAHYAITAVKRIGRDVGAGTPLGEAIEREVPNLTKHLERSERNVEAAKATDAMAALHGAVLSWQHGATHEPLEPRPAHLAADGGNFDTSQGVPASTGALPGVEPGCTCAWGPPNQNGRTLT